MLWELALLLVLALLALMLVRAVSPQENAKGKSWAAKVKNRAQKNYDKKKRKDPCFDVQCKPGMRCVNGKCRPYSTYPYSPPPWSPSDNDVQEPDLVSWNSGQPTPTDLVSPPAGPTTFTSMLPPTPTPGMVLHDRYGYNI